jgi:NDP-mannose synthase
MQALILAGGKGTRLAPFTMSFPKPLVPVGDRPILHHIIDQLREAGCTEAIISVNHLASLIEAYFGDGRDFGLHIRYTRETTPLGTAGPIAVAEGLGDQFILMNGDILSDVSFREIYNEHTVSDCAATIVSHQRDVPISLGVLVSDADGYLIEYREKPTLSYTVSTGIYVLSNRVRTHMQPGERLDMPDLMRRLISAGSPPRLHRHEGQWLDIGRVEDYQSAQELFDPDSAVETRQ